MNDVTEHVEPKLKAYQVILRALHGGTLNFEGSYYRFKDVPLHLTPFQRPHPPIWYGLSNPESAEFAADNKFNVVSNAAPKAVRIITDRYRAEWAKKGNDPAKIPFIGIARHVVIADTDAEAMRLARRAYARWWESFNFLWALRGQKPPKRILSTGGEAKGDRITHRIPIESVADIDADVKKWLKKAYELAKPVKK